MATGYEVKMYNDLGQIAQSLNRIANVMEAQEMRERQRTADVDPKSLGAMALWREQIARGDHILGFSEWIAWQEREEQSSGRS